MRRVLFAVALAGTPVAAQDMGHDHHGHDDAEMSAPAEPVSPSHAGHQAMDDEPGASADEPGNALPPPVPADHPGDRYNDPARMAASRMAFMHLGHHATGAVLIDMLEYRAVEGGDGYGWKAQAWYGSDTDRLAITTEGEGSFGEPAERAETALLWRHAIGPWFNMELGLRHDFRPDPERSYAVVGIEGLAPYWFELEGQVFVSDKGDVHARLGASHDLRISQKLVLQPSAELNAAFQDVPELGIGAGIERLELGARMRYEIVPEFAPYLGVHWEGRLGKSADLARAAGERASSVSFVLGMRAWF